jgi:hypothetical protein
MLRKERLDRLRWKLMFRACVRGSREWAALVFQSAWKRYSRAFLADQVGVEGQLGGVIRAKATVGGGALDAPRHGGLRGGDTPAMRLQAKVRMAKVEALQGELALKRSGTAGAPRALMREEEEAMANRSAAARDGCGAAGAARDPGDRHVAAGEQHSSLLEEELEEALRVAEDRIRRMVEGEFAELRAKLAARPRPRDGGSDRGLHVTVR